VDKVLTARLHHRKLQYRVQWLNHDYDPAWYPAGKFKNSPEKILEFHDRYHDRPGPPMRLQEWIRAALNDELLQDHSDEDKPTTAEGIQGFGRDSP
jgi:predicted DNA-binding protein (MmcQ/YjbR family)